jgi:hypothetical protein
MPDEIASSDGDFTPCARVGTAASFCLLGAGRRKPWPLAIEHQQPEISFDSPIITTRQCEAAPLSKPRRKQITVTVAHDRAEDRYNVTDRGCGLYLIEAWSLQELRKKLLPIIRDDFVLQIAENTEPRGPRRPAARRCSVGGERQAAAC